MRARLCCIPISRYANKSIPPTGAPRSALQVTDPDLETIEQTYRRRTPSSARMMERAARSMPRGLTRTLSWFAPYPLVFDHGHGATLVDVDGNRYVDMFSNGLSLMHGHAYRPIEQALRTALLRGSAWP